MSKEDLLDALAVTLELTGSEISKSAAKVLLNDLEGYPEDEIIQALQQIRFDGVRVTVSNIVMRLQDGRPSVEEAWAMLPHDEYSSQAITEEMGRCMGLAYALIRQGDMIGARMAFKEKYIKILNGARMERKPVKWFMSLGYDRSTHEGALVDAANKNRITVLHALSLMPPEAHESALRSMGVTNHPLLENNPEGLARLKLLQGKSYQNNIF